MSELFTNYEIGSIEMLIIGSFLMAAAWRLSKEAVSIIRKQKELKWYCQLKRNDD